jgi:hypothetical protein
LTEFHKTTTLKGENNSGAGDGMDLLKKRRFLFGAATVVYTALLIVFYWKYVPLVGAYQAALVPLLLIVTIVTAIDIRKGLLVFLFLFPLINNLPYFFKLYEPLPMAPSALVLFLFFFLGWLLHRTFAAPDPVRDGEKPNEPIFTPLRLFAALIAVSALITLWRYTNFFPFWRPRVYELVTNAFGTSAGGAIMSVVLFSLTYLTGIAFFAILIRAVQSETFVRKTVTALGVSTLLSVSFGLIQHFHSLTLGNNPISIQNGIINATFKDALSFGAYLSMIVPFFLGMLFSFNKIPRAILALALIPSGFLIFYAGSKSALISILAGLLFLALYALVTLIKHRFLPATKIIVVGSAVFIIAGVAIVFLLAIKSPINIMRGSSTIIRMESFEKSLQDRAKYRWTIAGRMMRDYPITGLGMGSYIIESSNYAKYYGMHKGTPAAPENLALQIGTELGIPGILLYLWILWELLRRIFKSERNPEKSRFTRALLPAALAGLIAFFLNVQAHSYIGSNEIHYLFWFFAAMLFIAPRTRPHPGVRSTLRITAVALIVISIAFLLWSSTHSLSLNEQTRRYGLRQEFGFGPREKDADGQSFRWIGRFAGQTVTFNTPTIDLLILASHPDIRKHPVRVNIFVAPDLAKSPNLLEVLTLKENRWEKVTLTVPSNIKTPALLLFEVDRTWSPRESGLSADPRNLGLAIGLKEPAKKQKKPPAPKPKTGKGVGQEGKRVVERSLKK